MNKFRESIQKMIDTGKAGKLGAISGTACVYRDGLGRFCTIGCLMPESLLDELLEANRLDFPLSTLFFDDTFNLADYGLSLDQGIILQKWHDEAAHSIRKGYNLSEFVEILEGILTGDITELAIEVHNPTVRRIQFNG